MTDPRAIELVMALRKQGVTDTRVLSAIETIPRDMFVDQPFELNAYDNSALPIACGQTISQPYVVAFATQALAIDPNGLDANYFYGDYLLDQGDKAGARAYLQKALRAPHDPNRPVWDAGRRREVQALLKKTA